MFYETSFLLLVILITAFVTRKATVSEYKQSIYELNRFTDRTLKRKLFIAKMAIVFLIFIVIVLWWRLPVIA